MRPLPLILTVLLAACSSKHMPEPMAVTFYSPSQFTTAEQKLLLESVEAHRRIWTRTFPGGRLLREVVVTRTHAEANAICGIPTSGLVNGCYHSFRDAAIVWAGPTGYYTTPALFHEFIHGAGVTQIPIDPGHTDTRWNGWDDIATEVVKSLEYWRGFSSTPPAYSKQDLGLAP